MNGPTPTSTPQATPIGARTQSVLGARGKAIANPLRSAVSARGSHAGKLALWTPGARKAAR